MISYKRPTLYLLFVFLFSSCTIEKPVEPTWEVKSTFPIINTEYSALSLINENNDIGRTDENGVLSLLYTKYFETIEVGDTLTIPDTFSILNFSVGKNIEIPLFNANTSQTLGDIFEESGYDINDYEGNTEIPEPGISNLKSKDYYYKIEDYDYILISEGGLNITLTNNTGITIKNIVIDIFNRYFVYVANDGDSVYVKEPLGNVTFNSLIPGASETQYFDLTNTKIQHELAAKISNGSIPAQSGISISSSATVDISVQRSDVFDFAEAKTKLEAQVARDTSRLSVTGNDLVELEEAILKEGGFYIQLKNEVDITGTAQLISSEITLNSQPLNVPIDIPKKGKTNQSSTVDLTGYKISSQTKTDVEYVFELNLDATDDYIIIKNTDSVRITANSENLTGSYFKGTIKPIDYDISKQSLAIDAFSKINSDFSLELFNPNVNANFSNSAGFGVEGNVEFKATNTQNATTKEIKYLSGLPIDLSLQKNGSQILHFDTLNSNLDEVFNILPNSVDLTGTVTVNPLQETGEVYDTNKVRLVLDILVPLALSVDSLSGYDTTKIGSYDTQDLSAMNLELTAKSQLPFRAKFRIDFYKANDNAIILENNNPFSIPRADSAMAEINSSPLKVSTINPDFYESDGETENVLLFELNEEEIRALEQATYAIVNIKADSKTDAMGSTNKVIVKSTDKINLRAVGKVNYKVNQD